MSADPTDELDVLADDARAERLDRAARCDVLEVDLGGHFRDAARSEDGEDATEQRPPDAAAAMVARDADEAETRRPIESGRRDEGDAGRRRWRTLGVVQTTYRFSRRCSTKPAASQGSRSPSTAA
jgi:hypothetical protein